MGDTQKIKRKAMYWRVLKVLFYVVGLPLLVYFVKEAAENYPTSDTPAIAALAGNGQIMVIYIALALVAVFAIQILLAFILKSKKAKAVLVALLAVIVTVAPILYSELLLKSQYEAVQAEIAEEYEVDISSWNYLVRDPEAKATEYIDSVEAFCDYFYIGYSGKNMGNNTDGSEITEVIDGTSIAYYSPNGMYADGYIFGYAQARQIMEDYYGIATQYALDGKDVEEELADALEDLYTPGSDYYDYCKGNSDDYISSPDEWELAYGEDGTATGYSVIQVGYDGTYSYEKLDEILGVLGTAISESDELLEILGAVGTLLPIVLGTLDIPQDLKDQIASINLKDLLANPDLCIDDVLPLLEAFGLEPVTLFDLIAQYSNYQSPSVYSVYHFIEDEDLQAYAFAKYYGLVHGAKAGSVLLSAATANEDGTLTLSNNVGEVTFDASGKAPLSWEELQRTFMMHDISAKYVAQFCPFIIGRNLFYVFGGIVGLGIIFSYYCAEKEKFYNDKLVAKKGGK